MRSAIFENYLVSLDPQMRRKNQKIPLLNKNCVSHTDINSSLINIKLVFLPAIQQAF